VSSVSLKLLGRSKTFAPCCFIRSIRSLSAAFNISRSVRSFLSIASVTISFGVSSVILLPKLPASLLLAFAEDDRKKFEFFVSSCSHSRSICIVVLCCMACAVACGIRSLPLTGLPLAFWLAALALVWVGFSAVML
jgi:hypothetical protein